MQNLNQELCKIVAKITNGESKPKIPSEVKKWVSKFETQEKLKNAIQNRIFTEVKSSEDIQPLVDYLWKN